MRTRDVVLREVGTSAHDGRGSSEFIASRTIAVTNTNVAPTTLASV